MSISEQLTEINNVKQGIKSAIINKGINMDNVPFTEYPSKISEIQGEGLSINGIIQQYQVKYGETVNAGDFVEFIKLYANGEFSNSSANYISVAKLNNDKVIIAYSDSSNSSSGTAVVIEFKGTTVTLGKSVVFKTDKTLYISIVALSESKAVVSYSTTGTDMLANVLTIDSETAITIGEDTKIVTTGLSNTQFIVALDESRVLAFFGTTVSKVDYTNSLILSIEGSSITKGTVFQDWQKTGGSLQNFAVKLTEDKVLLINKDRTSTTSTSTKLLCASIISVGETIQFGDKKSIFSYTSSTPVLYFSVSVLSESKVLVVYNDISNNYYGTAIVITVEGTTVTLGEPVAFSLKNTTYMSVTALSESKAVVVYKNPSENNYGTAIVITVEGTSITLGEPLVFENSTFNYPYVISLSASSIFVAHANGFNFLTIEGTNVSKVSTNETGTFVKKCQSKKYVLGIAKTGGQNGEFIDVFQPNE